MEHKGTHSRGYLPQRDYAGSTQGITFRLIDSVPKTVILKWRMELTGRLEAHDQEISQSALRELHRKIAHYEDNGKGERLLTQQPAAEIMQASLIHGHRLEYRLLDWCIMPNHVHVLIKLLDGHPLKPILQSWKGGSSRKINQVLNRRGPLWSRDYFDRFIRDEAHLHQARRYIRMNPVKAGLCTTPSDWTFSSAGLHWDPDA